MADATAHRARAGDGALVDRWSRRAMNLEEAARIAAEIADYLRPACQRVEVAGSIRRQRPQPKDIEIVAAPRWSKRQADMFTEEPLPDTDEALKEAQAAGFLV